MGEDVSKRTISILLVVLIAVSLAVILTSVNSKTTIIKGPAIGEVKLEIISPESMVNIPPAPSESNMEGEIALDITKKYTKIE